MGNDCLTLPSQNSFRLNYDRPPNNYENLRDFAMHEIKNSLTIINTFFESCRSFSKIEDNVNKIIHFIKEILNIIQTPKEPDNLETYLEQFEGEEGQKMYNLIEHISKNYSDHFNNILNSLPDYFNRHERELSALKNGLFRVFVYSARFFINQSSNNQELASQYREKLSNTTIPLSVITEYFGRALNLEGESNNVESEEKFNGYEVMMIFNLLNNATKYSDKKPVQLSIKQSNGNRVIEIVNQSQHPLDSRNERSRTGYGLKIVEFYANLSDADFTQEQKENEGGYLITSVLQL